MAARRSRHRVLPLLALLLLGASAAAPTPEEAARAARTAIDRAQYKVAAQTIEDALRRFGAQQTETVWSLRVMRGEVLIAQGSAAEARKVLAPELPPSLRTSAPAVRRLLMLASAAQRLREETTPLLNEAREIARRHQPRTLPEVYFRLATMGPRESYEEHAREAITLSRRYGDRLYEVKAMMALQFRHALAGDASQSIHWGEKALPLARSLQLEKSIGQILGNLGWMYRDAGDYEYAAELLTDAEAIAARIGARDDRVAWLIQLGNLRFQQREWSAADRYYREAAGYARADRHSQLYFALANLATIAIETGRFDDARTFNAEALELKRKAGDREAEMMSMIIDARIAVATDVDAAVKKLNAVIAGAKETTTLFEARGRLGEVLAKANRIDRAVEQFRLAVDVAREARKTIDSDALRVSFYNTTEDVFGAYVDLLIDQRRIEEALAVTDQIRSDTPSATTSATAVAKQEGATILSYWLGPRRSYVWTITPAGVKAAALPPDTAIQAAVDAYRRELIGARGTLQFSRARGEQLYKMLGIPANLARGSRVIVIPDGGLHALNFETLVVPAPKPHYWIEDVNVVAASSIHLLARPAEPANRAARMLLVGNPPSADPAFPPLPRANDEMRSIARHFPPARLKLLGGAAATPAAYRSASPQTFDFVHFVAHGTATRRRPLDSAVILGPDAAKNYKLLARDILDQPLNARLVTISSCHGAGARAYAGEGLVGLAWAFLHAGASNVIAALWEVNDSATPQLMNHVYGAIQSGRDPATALREAKLTLLRSNGAYQKPRYWAPFVFYAGS